MKHALAAILLLASVPFTAHATDPMTYDEIVAMAKSEVDSSTIIMSQPAWGRIPTCI